MPPKQATKKSQAKLTPKPKSEKIVESKKQQPSKTTNVVEKKSNPPAVENTKENREDYINCDIKTYEDSLNYTKKLVVVAISNIAYLRALLPEEMFMTCYFDNIALKIVHSKEPKAKTLATWVLGILDAINKKYLRQFTISIYEDPTDPENVIETYDFKLSYKKSVNLEMSSNKKKLEKLKPSSVRIIRSLLYSANLLDELPAEIFMNIRVLYYDDVTPVDYEPKGFHASDLSQFNFANGKAEIPIGKAHSLWHKIDLSMSCDKNVLLNPDEVNKMEEEVAAVNDSDTSQSQSLNKSDRSSDDTTSNVEIGREDVLASNMSRLKFDTSHVVDDHEKSEIAFNTSKIKDASKNPINPSTPPPTMPDKIICDCNLTDNISKLVKCKICLTSQHVVCLGLLVPNDEFGEQWQNEYNKKHVCRKCFRELKDPKEVLPIDPSLFQCDDIKAFGVEFNANMIASDLNYDLKRVERGLNNIQKTVKFTVTNEKENLISIKKSEINRIKGKLNFIDPTKNYAKLNQRSVSTESSDETSGSNQSLTNSSANQSMTSSNDLTSSPLVVSAKSKAIEDATSVGAIKKFKRSVTDEMQTKNHKRASK